MVCFRVREKENVFALQGEEPGAEQKWRGIREGCGWEQGRCGGVQGHWGRRGGDFCLWQERRQRELLEKKQRQTEGEGKLLHVCSVFLLHSEVRSWVERDVEADSRRGDLDG